MDASTSLHVRQLFGRRPILLHLSGFPLSYRRGVVRTKFTTSNNYLFVTLSLAILVGVVKYFFVAQQTRPLLVEHTDSTTFHDFICIVP